MQGVIELHKPKVIDAYFLSDDCLCVVFGINAENMSYSAVVNAIEHDCENYRDDCFEVRCYYSFDEGFTMCNPYYVLNDGSELEFKKPACRISESEFQNKVMEVFSRA